MPSDYLKRILNARVYDVARETRLDFAPKLSARVGNRVYLKREDEQPVFSFKLRGAYNKMAQLSPEVLARGVVAASAGNHAQGVALSSQRLGCPATIFMPLTTPEIKVDAVRELGAEVRLIGDTYDAAYSAAREFADANSRTFVHPYDDPDVIAGQGTIGLELLRQATDGIDAVFVAVGGGGLIAGIGAILKELRPSIQIIGVEPEDADAMTQSLAEGKRVLLDHVGRFADGVAVKQVGEETFRVAEEVVDRMVVVSNDEICAAIKEIFEDRRCILEPAGALAFAGLKRYVEMTAVRDQSLVAIACGANLNFDTLRHVSERAEIGERREAVFAIGIPERPGSFREFCAALGPLSITEFNYRYCAGQEAQVFVGVRIGQSDSAAALVLRLSAKGYSVLDLTDNEMAKTHVRHMVGGRAPMVDHERLFRFTFPERPGALMHFLQAMHHPWNISLFHYRNHGSDYGSVLAGIQVPPSEKGDFQEFLEQLGYEYGEETANPVCRLFLR